MAANLACDKFWVNKNMYHDAEKRFYECTAKLPGRLEILGGETEESNKKINSSKNFKKLKKIQHNNVDINELKKELLHLEAQENAKNKTFHSEMHCFEIINTKEENFYEKNENLTISDKKKQNKELQKEKKTKNEKKPKRTKENEDDLLGGVGMTKISQDAFPKTSLAGEVAKARQHIKSSLQSMENLNGVGSLTNPRLTALLEKMEKAIENLTMRVEALERNCSSCQLPAAPKIAVCPVKPQPTAAKKSPAKEDDDDLDLFSDSEEEDEEAKKIREQRLAEYAAKKSKKPAVVAKSNIILDIKPWDDETDMKEMEKAVRSIEMDGLVWGASKLMPVAFKIFKLQISCVIEDDKVSVDLLTETLESIEDYIQSVDIAAFNKV